MAAPERGWPASPDRRGPELPQPGRFGPEAEWLILELDLDYVKGTLLPQWVNRYLSGFEAKVVDARNPSLVLYDSAPNQTRTGKPDDTIAILDIRLMPGGGRGGRGGRGPGPPPDAGQANWQLMAWNQAGSLEALVARARQRNLVISAGILLLILAAVGTLLQLSRKAQQLAEQQINFVAGVSHELRTPLTVIRTAAFNLQGKLAARPESVSRYGELIQTESEKLAALVEQVLRFASAQAGHVIRSREPFAVETLIEDGLQSSRAGLEGSTLVVEKHIDPNLPIVLADGLAMRHALQNLVDNALKYGTEGSNWIGMFASAVSGQDGAAVEIRVADRGPGIPIDEQKHIFDPFFRGRRAVQDQVHGTGLGLNLVKRIVEAHGGTIRVHSEPMQGTEFVVRIPAAPPELQNEFTHSFN
jgi:signal transduction histidine kinase